MTPSELEQLVGQIGDELLARMGRPRPLSGEGHNIDDLVCPGCTQRCPQTCATKTANVIAAGADRVSASQTLTRVDSSIARLIDHTILKPDATQIVRMTRDKPIQYVRELPAQQMTPEDKLFVYFALPHNIRITKLQTSSAKQDMDLRIK